MTKTSENVLELKPVLSLSTKENGIEPGTDISETLVSGAPASA